MSAWEYKFGARVERLNVNIKLSTRPYKSETRI